MVVSFAQCEGHLHSYAGDNSDIDIESLDISTAFLQGLPYDQLSKLARELGYESRHAREVYITPPENVWRHFREISPKLYVRYGRKFMWLQKALKASYG